MFENTNLENITADSELVTSIMRKNGLECDGGWDYERMTFDRRFDVREGTFYLRVFACVWEYVGINLIYSAFCCHYTNTWIVGGNTCK